MNIQEYISSGIIENYVLGLTDEKESAEFEKVCSEYPEVRAAREAFEIALEQQALENAIQPPAQLKSKIFAEIEVDNDKRPVKEKNLITTQKQNHSPLRKLRSFQYANVAAVFLLVVSIALNIYFYNKYQDFSLKYNELQVQEQTLLAKLNSAQADITAYKFAFYVLKDTNMVEVKLRATPKSPTPNSFATVYWGKKTNEVFLLVKDMPKPDADKQYQLWALKEGKPLDAGIFDLTNDTTLIKLKNIQTADGFAVTLEKKGGSATPSLERMYVFGTMKKVEG